MKKISRILSVFLSALLLLTLCACGSGAAPAATAAPTQAPVASAALPDAGLQKAEPAVQEDAAAPEPDSEAKAAAVAFIDKDASALLAALGEPTAKSYAPSCLGPGEDGEWSYEGFTVYTYKENDSEIVVDVA